MFGRRRHCPLVGLCTDKDSIPLRSIKNRVSVKGLLAEVTSDLHYKNEDSKSVEATFTFPLDDDCAVYQFQATIDGRVTEAEVQTKESAKQTYKEAIEKNETAFLIEESDTSGDIFKCKIGNLPPETEAVLSFSYVVDLATSSTAEGVDDGSVVFTLPSVLNPRYCPAGFEADDGRSFEADDGVPVAKQKSKYDFDFQLEIDPVFPVKNVGAFGDQVEVGFSPSTDGSSKQLTTVKITDHKFDHDIRVKITYDRQMAPVAVFAPGHSDAAAGFLRQHVISLNFFPDLSAIKGAKLKKAEFVFIVDRSGSMSGSRIDAAKEALLLLLKSLPVGCTFNVVSFGNDFSLLFSDGSQPYSKETLDQALELQKTMSANMGGTEILNPLKAVFKKDPSPGMPRQVFLITDGEVGNTNEVIQLVAANSSTSRVFGIGIGEGASTSLLKGVARAGGGKAIFVTTSGQQRLQTKMMALLRQATQAFVDNVSISISDLPDGVSCVTQIPEKAPPVYNGERLVSYAVLAGDLKAGIGGEALAVLTGKIGAEQIRHELKVPLSVIENVSADAKMALHRLAAKTLIKHLETKIDEADKNDDDDRSPFGRRRWSDSENDDDKEADDKAADDTVDGKKKKEKKELSAEAKAKKELRQKRKREIVVISTSANVSSRFTAFVGVDPATKDKNMQGKAKVLVTRPSSPEMVFACAPQMMRCAPQMMAFSAAPPQPMMRCKRSARSAPIELLNCSLKSGSGSGFMSRLFGGGGSAAPPPPPPPNAKMLSCDMQPESAESSENEDMGEDECDDDAGPSGFSASVGLPPPFHGGLFGAAAPPPPGGPFVGSSFGSAAPPPSGGFGFGSAAPPPPGGSFVGSSFGSAAPPPSGGFGFGSAASPPSAGPSKSGDPLLDLVALQQFDGSWDSKASGFIKLIIAAAAAAGDEVEKLCREFSGSFGGGTALAIAALRIGQSARSEEWAMIEEKAMDWLEEKLGSAEAVTDLILKAEKVLIN